jgi:protein arginine N-methyltransferase 1
MIDYHRRMLADDVRHKAFHKALEKVIVPGQTTVADIGSGTGILAFLCEKLGAKECTLYESGDIARVSKQLIAENGLQHCHVVQKYSTQVKNPPKTDVVISETLGNYALEEHILEILQDAKRFLKPGGTMIPSALRQFVVPVTTDRFHKEINSVWGSVGFDLTFDAAKKIAIQNLYVRTFKPEDLLQDKNAAKQWDSIDFTGKESSVRKGEAAWTLEREAPISGFCLYWEADLARDVTLSTNPHSAATHWEQIYVPVSIPQNLEKGDVLTCALHSDTRFETGLNLQWKVKVERAGKVLYREDLDMQKGFLA